MAMADQILNGALTRVQEQATPPVQEELIDEQVLEAYRRSGLVPRGFEGASAEAGKRRAQASAAAAQKSTKRAEAGAAAQKGIQAARKPGGTLTPRSGTKMSGVSKLRRAGQASKSGSPATPSQTGEFKRAAGLKKKSAEAHAAAPKGKGNTSPTMQKRVAALKSQRKQNAGLDLSVDGIITQYLPEGITESEAVDALLLAREILQEMTTCGSIGVNMAGGKKKLKMKKKGSNVSGPANMGEDNVQIAPPDKSMPKEKKSTSKGSKIKKESFDAFIDSILNEAFYTVRTGQAYRGGPKPKAGRAMVSGANIRGGAREVSTKTIQRARRMLKAQGKKITATRKKLKAAPMGKKTIGHRTHFQVDHLINGNPMIKEEKKVTITTAGGRAKRVSPKVGARYMASAKRHATGPAAKGAQVNPSGKSASASTVLKTAGGHVGHSRPVSVGKAKRLIKRHGG